jgi:hypothetical protein
MKRSAKRPDSQSSRAIQGPEPPPGRPHNKTQDARAHFAALTAQQPVDEAFRTAFLQSKIKLVHTHPTLDLATRDLAMKSLIDSLGPPAQQAFDDLIADERGGPTPPVPGGVGYGFFYAPSFKVAWGQGTSLAFDIVCPTPPGGNINTWLYLTSTNRSAMGVEAFISYNDQNDTHFRVFDWARSDQWQTDIPLSGLTDYLTAQSAHSTSYQVLPVWNSTWQIDSTSYRNQVLLHNHVHNGWDLVYQYDYAATNAQQKAPAVGSWAPIVETFQSPYSGTSQMGALTTQLITADTSGTWGAWALLAAADSTVRTDNVGFQLVFLDPNYQFTVTS